MQESKTSIAAMTKGWSWDGFVPLMLKLELSLIAKMA